MINHRSAGSTTPTIHVEKDWRRFFESLQYAATKLNRVSSCCLIPDIVFIESQYNPVPVHSPDSSSQSPLTWFSQQKTIKGEGVFKVKTAQTTPHAILARLDRHLLATVGETVQPKEDRLAAVGMYHDRTNLLTFGDIASILTEAMAHSSETTESDMLCRADYMPFCFYFVTPPARGSNGKRYVATSMSSQREGTLLGQNTGTTVSFDWYERRGVPSRPEEWGPDSDVSMAMTTASEMSDNEATRMVMGGMRQICRCLAMPRFDVDRRISIRGAILEFLFDRNNVLWWTGIVSLTTIVDKPVYTPRTKHAPPDSVSLEATPYPDLIMDPNTYKLTTPSMTTPSMSSTPFQCTSKTPSRPGTAPSVRGGRRFTPTGRPMSVTKRTGGGHTYQMSVENMMSTRYTGIGKNNTKQNTPSRRSMSGKKASKSILLAHGARHCEPPALVAMAHQIDGLNGDLQSSIAHGKELEEDVREREHMLSVVNDHSKQLGLRINFLEQELRETKDAAAAREAELLKDLFETKKALEITTKENQGLKVVLESLQGKLKVVESSAVEERETIMRRMVEYDHQNRTLTAALEKRDNEVKSLSGALAKEQAANEAFKLQLADLQEDVDSMGMANALASSDIQDVTEERNSLYRNSNQPPPLQYKRGTPFRLYAWDIMASHPNPRAELEIVYSVFTHFDITLSQVYVHYATSSTTAFATGRKSRFVGSSRGGSGGGRLRLLMTRTDFRTFSRESQIWDHPLFPTSFIDLAYAKSILGGTRKGGREVVLEASNLNGGTTPRKHRYLVPKGTMTKRDFKEGLLRLSHARFPHLANVGEKLVVLFEKHIIPYCEAALLPEGSDEDDEVVRLGRRYETGFTTGGDLH
jgi:hypothetical protein